MSNAMLPLERILLQTVRLTSESHEAHERRHIEIHHEAEVNSQVQRQTSSS